MRGCLQGLAGIIGLLFVGTAVIALLIVNATHVLTNREVVKEALGLEAILAEVLPELINQTVAEQVAVQKVPLPDFDTTLITEMVLDTLPAGWLDGMVDSTVDGVFDYLLTGHEETAVITIDLNPLLNQLQGESGRLLVYHYLEMLPMCEAAQMLTLLSGELPTCVPGGIPLEQLSRQIHAVAAPLLIAQLSVGEEGIVTMPLSTVLTAAPEMREVMQLIRSFYQWAPRVWVLWLLPLVCLLLIAVLVVRSWGQWGIWWGWPLALAGLLGLLLSALIPGMVPGWWRTAVFTTEMASAVDSLWQPLLQQGLVHLSESWASRLGWQSAMLFALGFLFCLFGLLARKAQKSARTR
ncbi:MAG: hypothetical protein CSB13_07605 [Chloroflexi bacterium]|nr:MAG: hypothetical protein CSB13_07605 [Chloroflexota bacterium]